MGIILEQPERRQSEPVLPWHSVRAFAQWHVPEELLASPAVRYRNMFAMQLALRDSEELVKSYVYVSVGQMQQMVKLAFRYLPVRPFRGTGLEVGAGCGLLSSVVAQSPTVERVIALEICEKMCERVIPKVARSVLRDHYQKVVPVWGSFDEIQLNDDSIDFIVEIDSLHHSESLKLTLKECARVLKPGGQMLCFDRCQPDTLTDEEVEQKVSEVYSEAFLRTNCYPTGIRLTRRENGEHEYRIFEWKEAFSANGLRLAGMRQFQEDIRLAIALKGFLGFLPARLRQRLYRSNNGDWQRSVAWLKARLKGSAREVVRAPRSTTCFLLEKV